MKKHLVLTIVLLALSTQALACEISGVEGLPKEEVARLQESCEAAKASAAAAESKKEEKKQTPAPKPDPQKEATAIAAALTAPAKAEDTLTPYGKVAMEIAGAVGLAARELGLAINEFLWTPAGILTMAVIIGKLFGLQLLGLVFCICIGWAAYSIARRALTSHYEQVTVVWLWGLRTTTKQIPRFTPWKELHENQGATLVITVVATVLLEWAFLANMVV